MNLHKDKYIEKRERVYARHITTIAHITERVRKKRERKRFDGVSTICNFQGKGQTKLCVQCKWMGERERERGREIEVQRKREADKGKHE